MDSRKKTYLIQKIIALVLTIGIFGTLYYYSTLRTSEKPILKPEVNWSLTPTAARKNLTPEVYAMLSSNYKNFNDRKPKYVNFWAYWCLPCLEEIPALEQLAPEFENINFYFQNIDTTEESFNKAVEFSQQFPKLNFDFKIGEELKKQMNMTAVPMHLIIDKNQKIAGFYLGVLDKKNMKLFKELLHQVLQE